MPRSLPARLALAVLALPLIFLPQTAQADSRPSRHSSHQSERYHSSYPDRDCWVERTRHGNRIRNEVRCRQPSYRAPGWAAVPHRSDAPRYAKPRPVSPRPPRVIVVPTAPPPGPAYGEVYQDNHGRYCREYQTTATIGGKRERLYGTACMMPDGSWRFEG